METKYNLSEDQSILSIKDNLTEMIYQQLKVKICDITHDQTKSILNGINIGEIDLNDILAIQNLSRAWEYCLFNIKNKLDTDFILKINELVSENEAPMCGIFRNYDTVITGGFFKPIIPTSENINNFINDINNIKDPIKRAIMYLIKSYKMQLFSKGNRRTNKIISNKILLENDCGFLLIKDDHICELNNLLIDYYLTDNTEKIETFLYSNCIFKTKEFL